MADEFEEGSELLSREEWDETVEAVDAAMSGVHSLSERRQSQQQAASGERRAFSHLWLVPYADFMTILMIFFLGLYGYTVLAKAQLVRSHPQTMTYSDFAAMVGKLKGSLGEGLQVQEGAGRVTVRLADHVLFASGQSDLNEDAMRSLAEIAASLKLVEGEIVVEGHTDNVPIHGGRYRSNWELSAARTFSVIQALSKAGVPQERMAAWGFGDTRPMASNQDEMGRSKNRRIEIVINKKGGMST